jgi:hypothetical protein
MARLCKIIGSVVVVLGLVATVLSLAAVARDTESYTHAALAAQRNNGNIMYEAELGKAQLERAFELVGASLGALLVLNGVTLIGLGVVAGRQVPYRAVHH